MDKYLSKNIYEHPCFNPKVHKKWGRLHLPVSPRCNIECNYCSRSYNCINENRPGVSNSLLSPMETIEKIHKIILKDRRIRVIGIAGPGEPLYNDETFDTLQLVRRTFPDFILCLSTNGLLLPEKLDILQSIGVTNLTITINAVRPEVAKYIYSWVCYKGKTFYGLDGVEILCYNQLKGLKMAVAKGFSVKVNCVLIPSINEEHITTVARVVKNTGALMLNIMPLIPQYKFSHLMPPSLRKIKSIQDLCKPIIPQIKHCRQCRDDAIGLLEEKRTLCEGY